MDHRLCNENVLIADITLRRERIIAYGELERTDGGWEGDGGLLPYSILTCFCSHYEQLRRILVRIVDVPKNYYLNQIALFPENRIGDNFELLHCVTPKSRHFL
jgi:hypothetical protein